MKKTCTTLLSLFIVTIMCCAQSPITFWGLTANGGNRGAGNIYKCDTAGTVTDLYNFGAGTDGYTPNGNLIRAKNGLLYGMTSLGGTNNVSYGGDGTIFSYDIVRNKYTVVYNFKGIDGQAPNASLLQANDGLLYGLTNLGGTYDTVDGGNGTLFSYNILTGTETVLHDFGGAGDGKFPLGSLIQSKNGILYGMTSRGGAHNGGIIFSYTISTGTETDLFDFGTLFISNSIGAFPQGSLYAVNDSLLVGMTQLGGTSDSGLIFSYNIDSKIETDLHNFAGGKNDGFYPQASIIKANNGLLYGMAYGGGPYATGSSNEGGIIYSYNLTNSVYSVLYNFGADSDGHQPFGSLIQARNGLLYGTTQVGGSNKPFPQGTIFSFNISTGKEKVIHDFHINEGSGPFGDLLENDPLYLDPINAGICGGTSLPIYVSGATSYTWSPSTGLSATTGDSVVASPTVSTTYTITGTGNGWTATITDTIIVGTQPATPIITVHGDTLISDYSKGNQWYHNDTLIPGATQQKYVVTTGILLNYSVIVTDSVTGCQSTAGIIPEGINKIALENNIKLFPSPFNESFSININSSIENLTDWNLQVTNMMGQLVYTLPSLNYNNIVDLSGQPSGIYIITIKTASEASEFKMVKQN